MKRNTGQLLSDGQPIIRLYKYQIKAICLFKVSLRDLMFDADIWSLFDFYFRSLRQKNVACPTSMKRPMRMQ